MKTPIYDFAKAYADKGDIRLHMPGHKGKSFLGCEALDITEFDGADSLYHASGIILESENNASALFGSAHTFYSTEGSSHCIRAMLYLIKSVGGENTRILAGRNAHKTFISAAALLGIDVDWLYCEDDSYLSCSIKPKALASHISSMEKKPTAIYITSPDYLGNVADVEGISQVCRDNGIILAVDNAHGAYLKFSSSHSHPIDQGADICCDSAHKTLPVLTGGAYLHVSRSAPEGFERDARNALSLFGSTSPSYLILQSLDLANKYVSSGYVKKLNYFAERVSELKATLSNFGYKLIGTEPMKITISAKEFGYLGDELAEEIAKRGGVCEFYDPDFVVLMLTPELDLTKIKNILFGIKRKDAITATAPRLPKPKVAMSPARAIFAPAEELDTDKCLGRILASVSVSCPPAVPVVVCGEIIDETAIEALKYYGISKCRVIK